MRSRTVRALVACIAWALPGLTLADPAPRVAILCYHDLSEEPGRTPLTVSPQALREQIRSAKGAGWTFLPLSAVLARGERGEALPERVMVLTFDDGYRSFLTHALPILREENVPATLAIVDAFVDAPPPELPPLLTWKQIQQVEASGLVEIASHTHDLHRWVTSNPFRDTGPSVATRAYLSAQARYEGREEYRERIRGDLLLARKTLRAKLGHDVPLLVWPYGEHNEMARAEAAAAGFRVSLALGDRAALPEDLRQGLLPRILVTRETPRMLEAHFGSPPAARPVRAAQLSLDALYEADPQRFRDNIDRAIAQARKAGANTVVLQACADPPADGRLRETYFMNHQLPIKADIWSMVAAKLHHASLRVWIRAPALNLPWAWERHPEWRIPRKREAPAPPDPWSFRISPDIPAARAAAADLYGDIAVYLPIDGVLFDDDLFMRPDEQLRESGVTDPGAKAEALRELTAVLMRTVRAWRPGVKFGRTIHAGAAEHDGVDPGSAQDLGMFLRYYDLTVVRASAPDRSRANQAPAAIRRLARIALARWAGSGPAPLLFLLEPFDPSEARAARLAGVTQLGVNLAAPAEGALPDGILGDGFLSSVTPPARSRRGARGK